VAAGDTSAERAALPDEMLLPDELAQVARSHPGRKRLALGRRLEEGLGPGAAGAGGGGASGGHEPDGTRGG
jgi:hypothetical protein